MKKTILYTSLSMLFIFGILSYFSACKPDPCKTRAVECKNGGTCKDGDCLCELGFEGDSCQFKVNEKFNAYYACIRTRVTNGNLPSEDNDDTLRVTSLNDKLAIDFYSIKDSVFETNDTVFGKINGTVNGNYVTISPQDREFKKYKYFARYYGNGSLNNNWITITLYKSWVDSFAVAWNTKTTYVGYKIE